MSDPQILANPDPVKQGAALQVIYIFPEGGTVAHLTVTFDRDGEDVVEHLVILTGDLPAVSVPADALGCLIQDDSGAAIDCAVTVIP